MLSLEKCRQILGDDVQISDEDVERLRGELYALAAIATSAFEGRARRGQQEGFSPLLQLVPIDDRDAAAERVAILEYDAGLERGEAERSVLKDYMKPSDRRRR